MVNFKNITELPIIEKADGTNLIVNDNGRAKQIPASAVGTQADFNVTDENDPAFIKNKPAVVQSDWTETDETSPAFIKNKPEEKPARELMYEWNFSFDDDVYTATEDVDEDISWMTVPQEDCHFEIVTTCYYDYDNLNGEYTMWLSSNEMSYEGGFSRTGEITSFYYYSCPYFWDPIENDWSNSLPIEIYITNKAQMYYPTDWAYQEVAVGGTIAVSTSTPVKSIQIYKIYH